MWVASRGWVVAYAPACVSKRVSAGGSARPPCVRLLPDAGRGSSHFWGAVHPTAAQPLFRLLARGLTNGFLSPTSWPLAAWTTRPRGAI